MAKLPARPSLAFLASHNGSGMRAIVEAARKGQFRTEPVLVISNNGEAAALSWAKANKIPAAHISATTEGSEAAEAEARVAEQGGPKGPEPTRYGDWERKGIAVDF